MFTFKEQYDVIVCGGGNAALCAAIRAAEEGASVLLCEAAPEGFRGGNSRHTRNLRCAHDKPQGVLTEAYPEQEYWEDLLRVTGGATNETLARMTIRESMHVRQWMEAHGVAFQPSLSGTLSLSRTNAFFLGGGKALVNAYYRRAAVLGVHIAYATIVDELSIRDGFFSTAVLRSRGVGHSVAGRSLVVASGGFQANLEWLAEAWGEAARNFLIRGTPYNTGTLLKALLDAGVEPVGDPTQGHMVAIDGRAPQFDGGIVTRLDSVPFSIVVNKQAMRFYDEGEDFWPKRYAIWGRLVAQQPDQLAYSIVDAKALPLFMPSVFPPSQSETIEGLAETLGLDPVALSKTVDDYNAAVTDGSFDGAVLDGKRTNGLKPDKTNWAQKIDTPPYYGYLLRPGVTFTYLGVTVDEGAKVRMENGKPSANVFAAGEIMAGNILGQGYLAGTGMTIGTVFGRKAGENAARMTRN